MSGNLHVLRGTFRSDRHGTIDAPAPPTDTPKPHKKLTGEAKAEWNRVVAELEGAKSIATIDRGRLFQYVNLFAEVEAIKEQAATTQLLLRKVKTVIKNLKDAELLQAIEQIVSLQQLAVRQTSQLRQGRMSVRQYLNDLGLTPVARHGKVQAGGAQPKTSRLQQFMAGGGGG